MKVTSDEKWKKPVIQNNKKGRPKRYAQGCTNKDNQTARSGREAVKRKKALENTDPDPDRQPYVSKWKLPVEGEICSHDKAVVSFTWLPNFKEAGNSSALDGGLVIY